MKEYAESFSETLKKSHFQCFEVLFIFFQLHSILNSQKEAYQIQKLSVFYLPSYMLNIIHQI